MGFGIAKPVWNKVATLVPSTTAQNHSPWLGHFPQMREWIGERQIKNLKLYDYSITNKDFEATVSVPRNSLDDDSYGIFMPMMQEMGYAAATHPDEIVFDLITNGDTLNCFDGQAFFDQDHYVVDVGAVSNYQSGTGSPWILLDTHRPVKPFVLQMRKPYTFISKNLPTDDNVFFSKEYIYGVEARLNGGYGFWQMAYRSDDTLNKENFEANRAAMKSFKGDGGRPLGCSPTLLVCGPSNEAAANEVVMAERLANGASNTNYRSVEVLVTEWLE